MKVYYMNDEQKPVLVTIKDDDFYTALNSGQNLSKWNVTLKSCEAKLFELACPSGAVPYIKKWPNVIMISYIDASALQQLQQAQPHGDEA